MKTKTWIFLISIVLILCIGFSIPVLLPGQAASYAEILSDGQLLETVFLGIDQEFTITTAEGGENTVTVRDGKIAVTEANCPDHYCMARGFCDSGVQIVCLPNRLVIRFTAEQELDAVVG